MSRPSLRTPSYRLHKPTGLAVVTLSGRDFYLGKHGTKASKAEYDRVVAEWLANGRRLATSASGGQLDYSVNELILAYWTHAEAHYATADGRPSRHLANVKDALRQLRAIYGPTPASDFGSAEFKTVRKAMVDAGLCRNTVNGRCGKIRSLFRWAVTEELVPASVLVELASVPAIRRGRDGARETEAVGPVPDAMVDAVLPFVPAPISAMIRLQRLAGMRPGEATIMRAVDIDRSDAAVWVYRPATHKGEHLGLSRTIYLGPNAQGVLQPWLDEASDPTTYLFQPTESVEHRNITRRAARQSPMSPSQRKRTRKRSPKRAPRDHYDKISYAQSITRWCRKAFPHPEESERLAATKDKGLTPEQHRAKREELAVWRAEHRDELANWHRSHRWAPNRLRHGCATKVRKEFGLEHAQITLGHTKVSTTQTYAERDETKGREVALRIG